ncbi:MAG: RluA family pseudouridine synthase [Pseudobdellovibrio sp.]
MKTNRSLIVLAPEDADGLRIDKFLASLEEINSRTYAKNLIDQGLVSVNDKIIKSSFVLAAGQKLEILIPEILPSELIPYDLKLDILFEDSDLLVVNKPSGLVVHPAAGHQQDTLVNALLAHTKDLSMKNEQRPGIVHRIDKDTSGLLVVAKNDFTHEKLAEQFKNKTSHRIYYALVNGQVPRLSGICKSYLARHPVDRKRYASLRDHNKIISEYEGDIPHAKWAVTGYTKISQHSNFSYLKIKLETGRTHQIRVHMSELGHPLVGDVLYGFSQKKTKELGVNRFFLHAAELGFTHPKKNEYLLFKTTWPEEDQKKLVELGFTLESLSK